MGKQVRLSQLVVQFGSQCCAHVEIEIGNSNTSSTAALASFTPLQASATAAGRTVFTVTNQAVGRYVLIWFTNLPPMAGNPGRFEALIDDIAAHGFTAGQSG